MEPNKEYEQEIDLKDMIFHIFLGWRKMIVWGVIAGILFGAYKAVPRVISLRDDKAQKEIMENYEEDLSKYEHDKESLEQSIELSQAELVNKTKYLEDSVYANLDPYTISLGTKNYRFLVSAVEENIKLNDVLGYFMAEYAAGSLWSHLAEGFSEDIESKHISELVKLSSYSNNAALGAEIRVEVRYGSQGACKELLALVDGWMKTKYEEAALKFGSYQMQDTSESIANIVDLDLDKNITAIKSSIRDIKASNKLLEEELKALVEPGAPATSLTGIAKSSLKYIVIGGILGIFLVCAVLLFSYIMSDKVKNRKDVRARFGIKVLGDLSSFKTGRFLPGVDRFLIRVFHGAEPIRTEQDKYRLIEENLALHIGQEAGQAKLLVTGSIAIEALDAFAAKLNQYSKRKWEVISGGDVNYYADTISKVVETDVCVLVERVSSSSMKVIARELEALHDLTKQMPGIVLL